MRLKTGYSFNASDLFMNFNIKNIKTSSKILKEKYKTREKREVAVRVFLYAVYLILLDVIENNTTFVLPTSRRAQIQMSAISGKDFATARRNGKFKDVDFLESNFTGYQLEYAFQKREFLKRKLIYVDSKLKDKITKKTNEGMRYL